MRVRVCVNLMAGQLEAMLFFPFVKLITHDKKIAFLRRLGMLKYDKKGKHAVTRWINAVQLARKMLIYQRF